MKGTIVAIAVAFSFACDSGPKGQIRTEEAHATQRETEQPGAKAASDFLAGSEAAARDERYADALVQQLHHDQLTQTKSSNRKELYLEALERNAYVVGIAPGPDPMTPSAAQAYEALRDGMTVGDETSPVRVVDATDDDSGPTDGVLEVHVAKFGVTTESTVYSTEGTTGEETLTAQIDFTLLLRQPWGPAVKSPTKQFKASNEHDRSLTKQELLGRVYDSYYDAALLLVSRSGFPAYLDHLVEQAKSTNDDDVRANLLSAVALLAPETPEYVDAELRRIRGIPSVTEVIKNAREPGKPD